MTSRLGKTVLVQDSLISIAILLIEAQFLSVVYTKNELKNQTTWLKRTLKPESLIKMGMGIHLLDREEFLKLFNQVIRDKMIIKKEQKERGKILAEQRIKNLEISGDFDLKGDAIEPLMLSSAT